MTAKTKVGERLPYVLPALKAPRIAERLGRTDLAAAPVCNRRCEHPARVVVP